MTRGLGLGLLALCFALGGCDGDDTKKNAKNGGAGGGMGVAGGETGGSAGVAGQPSGGTGGMAGSGGMPSGGTGGAVTGGTGGVAGTGGEPVVPGAPGMGMTSAGAQVSSPNYSGVVVLGEAPGGNRVMSSASYQLRMGLVGATQ
ncbi:MAG: hypothetical protein H6718_10900 [Polyangiaceae bacterium]|nr:hypothetical protein [Myxococcales bacterium]MCB9585896.1 hypothetical protein [Polyangiaceae bacterium]MCB9607174.1 hypothetical protein [Polyangiaceae bacterium]